MGLLQWSRSGAKRGERHRHPLTAQSNRRRGWDSNPRSPCRLAAFRERYHKPLGHLSAAQYSTALPPIQPTASNRAAKSPGPICPAFAAPLTLGQEDVDRSLMLVTALAPVIGCDNASQIVRSAMGQD